MSFNGQNAYVMGTRSFEESSSVDGAPSPSKGIKSLDESAIVGKSAHVFGWISRGILPITSCERPNMTNAVTAWESIHTL